jgi:flagellar biosynthetic protein FlhB
VDTIAEKRFPATPKRKQEARKKGQVLKSQELTSSLMLLAMIGVLKFWMPSILERSANLFKYVYSLPTEWSNISVASLMVNVSYQAAQILAPLLITAVAVAVAVNYFQVGSWFSVEAIMPMLSRLTKLKGQKECLGSDLGSVD